MRLDDILNEFQKGHSHMAVVTRECNKKTTDQPASNSALAHSEHLLLSVSSHMLTFF